MRFTLDPNKLQPATLFKHLDRPEVRDALAVLLYVEHREAKYREVRLPQRGIAHAFIDAYHDLWKAAAAPELEAHKAAIGPMRREWQTVLERDLEAVEQGIEMSRSRRKQAKNSAMSAAGMRKVMSNLRGTGTEGGGVFELFRIAHPGFGPKHPQWHQFAALLPLGPEGAAMPAEDGPAKDAADALAALLESPLGPHEQTPKKRTDYMRRYMRERRAAKKAEKAEAKAVAATLRAEAHRKIYETDDIDPLS